MHARWTVTVPLTLNDGTATDAGDIAMIEGRICAIAGGFTASPAEGVWRDPKDGRIYREPVTVYTFDVGHLADNAVRRLARDIAAWLDQEAVYTSRQDVSAQLVYADTTTRQEA